MTVAELIEAPSVALTGERLEIYRAAKAAIAAWEPRPVPPVERCHREPDPAGEIRRPKTGWQWLAG